MPVFQMQATRYSQSDSDADEDGSTAVSPLAGQDENDAESAADIDPEVGDGVSESSRLPFAGNVEKQEQQAAGSSNKPPASEPQLMHQQQTGQDKATSMQQAVFSHPIDDSIADGVQLKITTVPRQEPKTHTTDTSKTDQHDKNNNHPTMPALTVSVTPVRRQSDVQQQQDETPSKHEGMPVGVGQQPQQHLTNLPNNNNNHGMIQPTPATPPHTITHAREITTPLAAQSESPKAIQKRQKVSVHVRGSDTESETAQDSPVRLSAATVVEPGAEFVRASHVIQEQVEQMEALGTKLLAAMKARDRAEAALKQQKEEHVIAINELRGEHEAQILQIKEKYEHDLEVKSQQLAITHLKIDRLEQQLAARPAPTTVVVRTGRTSENGASNPTNSTALMPVQQTSAEELAALQREVAAQERLLAGYQLENEAATRRIKELELSVKELRSLRRTPPPAIVHEEAGRNMHASSKDAASRLAEVLALQQQLEAVKEQSAIRETELRTQLEKLRAHKKEVEARKAGVDMRANQEGDVLVAQVRSEMETMRAQYTSALNELRDKLKWYAENQELLSANDQLVRQQQETITQLEARLQAYEGHSGRGQAARITELQTQVAALQAALKAKGLPKSLAAVIEAAKPGPEVSSAVAGLQKQVADLKAKLAAKDEEYEVQLRSYQQQYEQLRIAFEERQQQQQAANSQGAGGGRSRREAALTAQLEEQRTMYTRQLKELRTKLQQAQAQAATKPPGSPAGSKAAEDKTVLATSLKAKEAEVSRLQQDLQKKSKQVAELHLKLGELEARVIKMNGANNPSASTAYLHSNPTTPLLASPARLSTPQLFAQPGIDSRGLGQQYQNHQVALPREQDNWPVRVSGNFNGLEGVEGRNVPGNRQMQYWTSEQHLQQQHNNLLAAQVEVMKQQLAAAQQQLALALNNKTNTIHGGSELEVAARRAEAAELALSTVQKAHTEAVERCASLREEHQRALIQMRDEVAHTEALKWREKVAALESDLTAARMKVATLEVELANARAAIATAATVPPAGWSPTATDFAALERRLENMAQEAAAREAKWREVLNDTRQLYAVQSEVAARKMEARMLSKNTELQALKARVDDLLHSAARLQQQQRPA